MWRGLHVHRALLPPMSTLFINGKYLAQAVTGVQRFASQILEAADAQLADGIWRSERQLVLLAPSTRVQTLPRFRHIEIREIASGNLHVWEQIHMPMATRGSTLLNLAGSAPLLKLGQICTFHDTAVFDFPAAYSKAFSRWYRFLFAVQGRLSHRLLTVSQFSKDRLCQHLGIRPEKVGVVPNGASHIDQVQRDDAVLQRFGLQGGSYLLAVGSDNPSKNFPALLTAFTALKGANARLVVVGGGNGAVFSDSAFRSPASEDPRIVRTGRLSDAELKALYTQARAFVFPSLYEGFGIPPLEAMASGCPVLAAHAASIPEVCGDAVGYFDPRDPASITAVLKRAIDDDAWLAGLRIAGRAHVANFTWNAAAEALLEELASVGVARTSTTSKEIRHQRATQ